MKAESLALLYDVHGNLPALEAVLADVEERDVDGIVFGGDYALKGPHPSECVDRIRETGMPAIRGNTDVEILEQEPIGSPDPLVAWTRQQLGAGRRRWLAQRPFEHRIRPPSGSSPRDDLLLVHATPTDIEAVLLLEPHPYEGWPVTPDADAKEMIGDAVANLIVFGHIHSASEGAVAGQPVRSVGSVGFPWDGDPRAAYAIAEWRDGGWNVDDIRVAYDHEAVADEIESSEIPDADKHAESIRTAGFEPTPRTGL